MVLKFYSCTTAQHFLGRHVKVSVCILFSNTCKTLGVRNVLRGVESSLYICFPAKYTVLPVQHTNTQK